MEVLNKFQKLDYNAYIILSTATSFALYGQNIGKLLLFLIVVVPHRYNIKADMHEIDTNGFAICLNTM